MPARGEYAGRWRPERRPRPRPWDRPPIAKFATDRVVCLAAFPTAVGQSASMPTPAAASTERCHASAAVAPWSFSQFSPFDPSTCQIVLPEEPVWSP
jgi:hypothetical protein